MRHFGRLFFFAFAAVFAIGCSAQFVSAQWGGGPVLVYNQRDGRGDETSFNVGTFRNDRGEFGTLRNDSAYSVSVPNGYRIRLCENEGNGNGGGRCEEYGQGNHNLRYAGTASYIQVTGPGGNNWGRGWNGGGERGVTVYEDSNSRGRSQTFGVGRYLNAGGQLGALRNDSASSVVVAQGFRVRLCEDEGTMGIGSGRCEEYGPGRYNLRYNDSASYIEVRRTAGGGWFGGRWDTNGVFNEGDRGGIFNNGGRGNNNNGRGNNNGGIFNNNRRWGNDAVVVFEDSNQNGRSQTFGVGTYRNDQNRLGNLRNDSASSIYVPPGFHVQLCEGEGGGRGSGRCEDYGAGTYNLRYNDSASFIRVWRGR